MKAPTVSRCCCCIDLRKGGIILGIFGIVYLLLSFILGYHWINLVVPLIIEILWLVGIFKDNPKLLLPSIFLTLILIIVLLLSPLFLPYFIVAVSSEEKYKEMLNSDMYWFSYLITCVIIYIVAAIGIYFLTVRYSVYKLIDEKVSGRSNQANNYEASLPNYEA